MEVRQLVLEKFQKSFGEFLTEKRKEKKITMRELERRSGISQAYISQLENGKRNPPKPEVLKKLAEALEIQYILLLVAAGYMEEYQQEIINEFRKDVPEVIDLHKFVGNIVDRTVFISEDTNKYTRYESLLVVSFLGKLEELRLKNKRPLTEEEIDQIDAHIDKIDELFN